jgi:hypothetical protein
VAEATSKNPDAAALDTGWADLAGGRWAAALACFERRGLEGDSRGSRGAELGAWSDADVVCAAGDRAYRLYKRRGDRPFEGYTASGLDERGYRLTGFRGRPRPHDRRVARRRHRGRHRGQAQRREDLDAWLDVVAEGFANPDGASLTSPALSPSSPARQRRPPTAVAASRPPGSPPGCSTPQPPGATSRSSQRFPARRPTTPSSAAASTCSTRVRSSSASLTL